MSARSLPLSAPLSGVLLLSLLLTGCGGGVRQDLPLETESPAAASSPATPVQEEESSPPAEEVTSAPVEVSDAPASGTLDLTRFELERYGMPDVSAGPHALAQLLEDDSIEFLSSTADLPLMVVETEEPDRKYHSRDFGVQQDPGEDPTLLTVSHERTRAEGLSEGAPELVLRQYSETGSELTAVTLPLPKDVELSLIETHLYAGTAIISSWQESDGPEQVVHEAFSLDGGDRLWARTCERAWSGTEVSTISPDGIYALTCDGQLIGVDVLSGDEIWGHPIGESNRGAFPLHSPGPVLTTYYDGVWNGSTGTLLFDTQDKDRTLFDPRAHLVIGSRHEGFGSAELTTSLRVVDAGTGAEVLSVPEDNGLGPFGVIAAYDGCLWIRRDNHVQIVDARTGETTPASPPWEDDAGKYTGVPLAAGESWVLLGESASFGETATSFYRDPGGDISLEDLPATVLIER